MTRRRQRRKRIADSRARRKLWLSTSQLARAHPEYLKPSEYHFDRDGRPMSFMWWMRRFDAYRRIAETRLAPDLRVSTIWTGLATGDYDEHGRPLIFETAILRGKECKVQMRHATEAQARAIHDGLVVMLRIEQHNARTRARDAEGGSSQ